MSPTVEQLVEDTRSAQPTRLSGREAVVEGALAGGFLAVAAVMAVALPWERSLYVGTAALLVLVYALASRVRLEDGAGYTTPTQIVFVPMLYFLPAPIVPLAVAAAMVAGNVPDYVTRRKHPGRVVLSIGDAWHAIAPALVFGLGGAGEPDLGDWPLLAAALGAQFALDFAVSTTREWLGLGISPRVQPRLLAWVFSVDACLAPIGLFAALLVATEPLALLLLVPVSGLLAVWAHERHARISGSLELSHAYRGTARLLGEVVEADDAYTGSHSRSVVDLSLLVADRMGVDSAQRRNVEFAALLHDVGKIAIPKEIINKPGPLTDDEWTLMRTHTIVGQQLLDRVGGVLSDVGRIVRASHERFDGHGYPDGLAGREIPLAARIVSCCDAFNAMTTERPYRMPMSLDVALRELVDHAGTQFDPKVVRVLIAVLRRPTAAGPPDLPLLSEPASTLSPAH